MKIQLRFVYLRFFPTKPRPDQVYFRVGIFYIAEGDKNISNVFVKYSNETLNLPIILLSPEIIFPNQSINEGTDLSLISISREYDGDFTIGQIHELDIGPAVIGTKNGQLRTDKYLFTTCIANEAWFRGDSPIYRFKMHDYAVPCAEEIEPVIAA